MSETCPHLAHENTDRLHVIATIVCCCQQGMPRICDRIGFGFTRLQPAMMMQAACSATMMVVNVNGPLGRPSAMRPQLQSPTAH